MSPSPDRPSNIASRSGFTLGDVDAGFAEADVVIERNFRTRPVHQGYIEPHACLVSVGGDGRATIWSSSQGHFMVRNATAKMTGARLSDIRAIPAEIGGGFGGKTIVYLEPLAYALSRKSGAPVKMVMTREEVFRATGPTSGSSNTVRIGAKRDGTIVAAEATFRFQAGAFPGSPVRAASNCAFAPYNIPNVSVVGYDVVMNRPKCNAYRAPGSPIAAFGVESVMDELAEELGMDPIALREKNAAQEGTRAAYGPTFRRIGFQETLEAAKAHPHYSAPVPEGGRPRHRFRLLVQRRRRIERAGGDQRGRHGRHHHRTSGHRRLARVHGEHGGGDSGHPLSQRQRAGGRHQQHRLQRHHRRQPGDIRFRHRGDGGDACRGAKPARTGGHPLGHRPRSRGMAGRPRPSAGANAGDFEPLSLAELAGKASQTGGPIVAQVSVNAQGAAPAFATHICDVAVDRETGKVDVVRYTAVQDAGRAIHPDYVEGQIQGGVAQGIGWALNEEYIYDDNGQLENPGFLDYRIPVASDLPMIETEVVEVPNDAHPLRRPGRRRSPHRTPHGRCRQRHPQRPRPAHGGVANVTPKSAGGNRSWRRWVTPGAKTPATFASATPSSARPGAFSAAG